MVIDSQVHAYEANTPQRPWASVPNWPPHVTGDEMVAAMDKVGVDGAIFISAFSMYQYDASYAVEVQRAHPDRFAIVKPVDPDDPAVADVIADWKKTPGTVGIRIIMTKESNRAPDDPGLDRICRAAVKHENLPWFLASAVLVAISQAFVYASLAVAPLMVVTPILQLSLVFRLFLSQLINREHEVMNTAVVIGAFTAVLGSLLVSLDTDELTKLLDLPLSLADFLHYRLAGR